MALITSECGATRSLGIECPNHLGLCTLQFAEKTGWKFQMHNRRWSEDNVYAKQNGGNYELAIPDGPPSR